MKLDLKLQELASQYEKLQLDINALIRAKTLLDSQLSENEAVQKEFSLLKDENDIYKLIGPVLVKQERVEAETNVKKRIEFINSEIKRLEKQIKDMETKSEAQKLEIVKVQQLIQEAQKQAVKA